MSAAMSPCPTEPRRRRGGVGGRDDRVLGV